MLTVLTRPAKLNPSPFQRTFTDSRWRYYAQIVSFAIYHKVLDDIDTGHTFYAEHYLASGSFAGQSCINAFRFIRFEIYAALAKLYLEMRNFREVDEWTEEALFVMSYSSMSRHRVSKSAVYAQVWYWKAIAKEVLAGPRAASRCLTRALSIDETNGKWLDELRELQMEAKKKGDIKTYSGVIKYW